MKVDRDHAFSERIDNERVDGEPYYTKSIWVVRRMVRKKIPTVQKYSSKDSISHLLYILFYDLELLLSTKTFEDYILFSIDFYIIFY